MRNYLVIFVSEQLFCKMCFHASVAFVQRRLFRVEKLQTFCALEDCPHYLSLALVLASYCVGSTIVCFGSSLLNHA